MARLVGQKMTEAWGQPVVVDNRPGATGIIGTDLVAKSPPDGYMLALVASSHAINPSMVKKLRLRHHQEFRAGGADPRGAADAGGVPFPAGEIRQGTDRLWQGQPGQAVVRVQWLGRRAALLGVSCSRAWPAST
ncbi:tripartite tricarboxylate transporter substrate-binding protein [Cupriavidus basilensis]